MASNLVGEVINVDNGNWVRQQAGIGAGIDSYYEYMFKAGIQLNSGELLDRFKIHYDAVEKYIFEDSGPLPLQVYRENKKMHRFFKL